MELEKKEGFFCMESEVDLMLTKMNFEFSEREEGSGLQVINDMLMSVKFAKLEIGDLKGYLVKCQEFDPDGKEMSVTYRFGFDFLTLNCTMDTDSDGLRYQIAVEVVPDHENSDQIHQRWMKDYPDRKMRSQTTMHFTSEKKKVSVILYRLVE